MSEEENKLFMSFAELLESYPQEVDVEDLLCALLRITAAVVSQAPDEIVRGSLTNFIGNAYNLYLANYLEASEKPMTKEETKAAKASELFFSAMKGDKQ